MPAPLTTLSPVAASITVLLHSGAFYVNKVMYPDEAIRVTQLKHHSLYAVSARVLCILARSRLEVDKKGGSLVTWSRGDLPDMRPWPIRYVGVKVTLAVAVLSCSLPRWKRAKKMAGWIPGSSDAEQLAAGLSAGQNLEHTYSLQSGQTCYSVSVLPTPDINHPEHS